MAGGGGSERVGCGWVGGDEWGVGVGVWVCVYV